MSKLKTLSCHLCKHCISQYGGVKAKYRWCAKHQKFLKPNMVGCIIKDDDHDFITEDEMEIK